MFTPEQIADIKAKIAILSDREVIAMTAKMEADILGAKGMQATINTVQNRLASGYTWWGNDLRDICLYAAHDQPWHQYSCWNFDNSRLPKILSADPLEPLYAAALQLADEAMAGLLDDITNGSTHYVNHLIVHPLPKWASEANRRWTLEPHWYYRAL
jgi:cell wall hydrolase